MTVFKLTIEYDGTPFGGWQKTQERESVQGTLEKALTILLRAPFSLQGASRTDAGVHATGQVASLRTDALIPPNRLVRGLSALCAPHIAVTRAEVAPDDFNARFDTTGKHYLYTVLNRSARSPLYANRSWHVPARLDPERMRTAADRFVGTFDFAGFRAADCGRDNTVRTVTGVDLRYPGGDLIEIHVTGTAFLKHMVRIMAGTLVDIGRGALPVDTVEQVLASKDRRLAGRTAPARGLTLLAVFY